jgi:hypothetical protein
MGASGNRESHSRLLFGVGLRLWLAMIVVFVAWINVSWPSSFGGLQIQNLSTMGTTLHLRWL